MSDAAITGRRQAPTLGDLAETYPDGRTMDFARHAGPRVTAGYTRTTQKCLRAVVPAIDY